MSLKNYQLAWGILLLFYGCMADFTTPTQECVKNEAGECADKQDLYNNEERSNLKDNVVEELSKCINSQSSINLRNCEVFSHEDYPNVCTKQVNATSSPSKEWILMSEGFKALNITFPVDFSVETQYICCDGYAKEDEDSLCLPVCSSECGVNSYCKNPDMCECFEGFLRNPNGQCVSEGEDFRADDPHVCSQKIEVNYVTSFLASTIKHGNLKNIAELVSSPLMRQNQNKTRTEVHFACCSEYEQKSKGGLCELKPHKPTCALDCPAHSTCIADEVCQCEDGYSGSPDSCQPVCAGETIEHSRCVRPGEWDCDNGYIKLPLNQGRGFSCEPHCSNSCTINAHCVAPNVCECLPGHVTKTILFSKDNQKEICIPDFSNGKI